jgi:hypothetical protein
VRRALVVLALLAVVGCDSPGEKIGEGDKYLGGQLNYIHDQKHHVGCWIIANSGRASVACLPDSQYTVAD